MLTDGSTGQQQLFYRVVLVSIFAENRQELAQFAVVADYIKSSDSKEAPDTILMQIFMMIFRLIPWLDH
ncbi:MAG: hypothetical protein CM1200mP10_11030 [Candidatus Neomarinimicrobiota bacterium]|nr:MAG: hypothetical protein CM1200mP10_11030 [Candidatus Neomarinimicrobiota bacterium]